MRKKLARIPEMNRVITDGRIMTFRMISEGALRTYFEICVEHEPDQFTTIELEQADVDALVEFVGQQQRKTA